MRAVIQRVTRASVAVDGRIEGQIGAGLLVLLGVAKGDEDRDVQYLVEKIATLRIFVDPASTGPLPRMRLARSTNRWWQDSGAAGSRSKPGSLGPTCGCRWRTTGRSPLSWTAGADDARSL